MFFFVFRCFYFYNTTNPLTHHKTHQHEHTNQKIIKNIHKPHTPLNKQINQKKHTLLHHLTQQSTLNIQHNTHNQQHHIPQHNRYRDWETIGRAHV